MESIEYCLDELLRRLRINWRNWTEENPRVGLDGEGFLKEMGFPNVRLRHFFEFIMILKEDGYISFEKELTEYDDETQYFEKSPIITAKGLFFIEKKGYQKKLKDDQETRTRLDVLQTQMTKSNVWISYATWILAIGGLIAAAYYLKELFCG